MRKRGRENVWAVPRVTPRNELTEMFRADKLAVLKVRLGLARLARVLFAPALPSNKGMLSTTAVLTTMLS
jgi:hypothetical protein